ncbi:MAG: (2Fe-2S)-binding protein [Phycisphaerales bacterium]|nr:MAG: (2Fe-2S)-binding protein [Phycisphaerales bacterium]
MTIDRCVCIDTTFDSLLRRARAGGLGFEALCESTECCRGCTLCEPYVRAALASGQTVFDAAAPAPAPSDTHPAAPCYRHLP